MKKSYFFKTLVLMAFVLFWAGNGLMAQNTSLLEFDAANNESLYRLDDALFDINGQDYTIEAWIYLTTVPAGGTYPVIASREHSWEFYLRESSGNTGIGFVALKYTGDWDIECTVTSGTNYLTLNTWHHIAVSSTGSSPRTTRLFIDGTIVGTETYADFSLDYGDKAINIGARFQKSNTTYSRWLDGCSIDEFRFNKSAKYTVDFTTNITDGPLTADANTILLYHFNSNSGSSVIDYSGNGLNGTLRSGHNPSWVTWRNNGNQSLPLADIFVWNGGTDTDWGTATNWDPGVALTSTDDVIIPDVTSDPSVSGDAATPSVCNSLTIETGGVLTIPVNKALTVNGTLINNGTFTIQSNEDGTGSLWPKGTATGSIIMQRYIAAATWGTWNDGWHFLSSPVADYPIQDNFTVATAANYDFYAWSEPENEWINFKTGDTPSFLTVNGSEDFELGYGYMAAYKDEDTKEFTGTINVSDVDVTGLNITGTTASNRSWHLLGNPFTSALTWYTGWSITGAVSGTAKIWHAGHKSFSTLSEGDPIPATNGFLVQATATGSSLTIPESKRLHSTQAFYKNVGYPIVKLKANNIDYPSAQESELRFNPESTLDWDMEFDSDFLSGFAPLFYSKIDDMPMAVNSMPDYNENSIIPFTFIKNEGLNFSIEMYEIANMDTDVWLVDKKSNKRHNLSDNPEYVFTSFEGDDINRFEIHFSPLGLEEQLPTENRIQIWASNNTVSILNHHQETGTISIVNTIGQTVLIQQLNGSNTQRINTNLNTGIYIVSLKLESGYVISEKVIIK